MRSFCLVIATVWLTLLGAVLPAQGQPAAAVQAQCVSKYGKTECGYSCVAAYGSIRCAQTPQGACAAANGTLTCFDPPAGSASIGRAECLSRYGKTVCGFGCVAQYGQIQCATRPGGVCQAAQGSITCFDPPPGSQGAPRWGGPVAQPVVQATCKNAYGRTECGYGCVAKYGTVKCAQTPMGSCIGAYGKVTCWDPPQAAQGWGGGFGPAPLPVSQCVAASGVIACGFGCAQGGGRVQCAQWPGGICQSANGRITCWEPQH